MIDNAVRFGSADLSTCDREPIHIPGTIYPYGAMLVLNRQTHVIEQLAGDTSALLGIPAERLRGSAVGDFLGMQDEAFVAAQLAANMPFVAPVIRLGVHCVGAPHPLDLTLHAIDGTAILEFEPARRAPGSVEDPITELKVLLRALQRTDDLGDCFATAAVTLRAVTGFDRAMVYQFMPDESGVVIAEDARPGLETFLGLHYPASDIPKQARELYRRNWLRAIPDVNYRPMPLEPAINPRTGAPLNMSFCSLRSVSPIHLEYLRNMGVCASLSASIVCRDQLWGLLVLHHYAPLRVPADLRLACETFAQVFSLHIEVRAQTEKSGKQLGMRRLREELWSRLKGGADLADALMSWSLARYVGATGAAVRLGGKTRLVGVTPAPGAVEQLVGWLDTEDRRLFATEQLAAHYAPAAGYAKEASGLLAVSLAQTPGDYLLWFRPEHGETVRWGGDPHKPITVGPLGVRLTPRGSFAEWLEERRQQAMPWSGVELEAAEALRVLLLEHVLQRVEMDRREEAVQAAQLATAELERRVQERTAQLRALASALESAEDRERRQIARDLHDDLGQTLAAARIRLAALCDDGRSKVSEIANEVGALIDLANNSIRSLAAQLSPAVLYELGLSPALEWLAEEIEQTFRLRVTVKDDRKSRALSQEARSILFRGVRELLINVAKHAETDAAEVESVCKDGWIRVSVSDRGIGYDPAAMASSYKRGLGLIGLAERLSFIGGSMDVCSSPGHGSRTVLRAPLAEATGAPTRSSISPPGTSMPPTGAST